MCRHAWRAWLAIGIYLEFRGWRKGCHKTLSRTVKTTRYLQRCRWSPLMWVLLGGWFSWHVHTLKDLAAE